MSIECPTNECVPIQLTDKISFKISKDFPLFFTPGPELKLKVSKTTTAPFHFKVTHGVVAGGYITECGNVVSS